MAVVKGKEQGNFFSAEPAVGHLRRRTKVGGVWSVTDLRDSTIRTILTLAPLTAQFACSGSILVTGQDRFKLLVDIVKNLKEKGTVLCRALKLSPVSSPNGCASSHAHHCNLQCQRVPAWNWKPPAPKIQKHVQAISRQRHEL